jgi:hypothetical protein
METPLPPQIQAPARSREQRLAALAEANQVRSLRAALKADLREGRVSLEGVLTSPPDFVRNAKVSSLLASTPQCGPVKAAKIMDRCRISAGKTVAGLSERQRAELIASADVGLRGQKRRRPLRRRA